MSHCAIIVIGISSCACIIFGLISRSKVRGKIIHCFYAYVFISKGPFYCISFTESSHLVSFNMKFECYKSLFFLFSFFLSLPPHGAGLDVIIENMYYSQPQSWNETTFPNFQINMFCYSSYKRGQNHMTSRLHTYIYVCYIQ